jgi:hypothetical protein
MNWGKENSFIIMIKRMKNDTKNLTMKDAISHMTEAIPATFTNTNLMLPISNQIKNQFIP